MVSVRTAITAYSLFAFLLLVGVVARPVDTFVLVITSPAGRAEGNMAIITDAGGNFVWAGRFPWISVAQSDDPDFPRRLFQAGAYLVLNHDLAVGCLKE